MWILALALVIAVLLAGWWIHVRREGGGQHLPVRIPGQHAEGADLPLAVPQFNPLQDLSFEDALDGEKFALAAHQATERALADSVRGSGFQLGNLSLQVLSGTRDGFIVTFDKGTAEFVRTAQGVYKAQTRGPKGGFQEIGNIDQLGTWANRAASVTAITVAVANIISNADASKKLGKLMEGQDRQFAYRAIDQLASLKTAYEELREALHKPVPDPGEIDRIRHRIRNVRHILMEEAKHDLNRLTLLYPERQGPLAKARKAAGDWCKRKLTNADDDRMQELNEYRGKLLLARHCVRFEDIAATISGAQEHQEVLLREAKAQLLQMLPKYQELERELPNVPSAKHVLLRLFEGGRADGQTH